MDITNRSAEVAAWVNAHRNLFTGDAESKTRALLVPLAQHLNTIEGRDVWGLLVKTDRNPEFIPHDILNWRDTGEHVDVFTGPDSGRAEDVQPVWGYNPSPNNPQWVWQSVEAGEPALPNEGPLPEPGRIEPSVPEDPSFHLFLAFLQSLDGRMATMESRSVETLAAVQALSTQETEHYVDLRNVIRQASKDISTNVTKALSGLGAIGSIFGRR